MWYMSGVWRPGSLWSGLETLYPYIGQDLNNALGDLVLYNFSANTWIRWDLSPAPVWTPLLPCLEALIHSVRPS